MTPPVSRVAFPAMSTSIALTGVGVSDRALARAAGAARRLAEEWEQRFSRFRPDSLLCRLNAANGQPFSADETFLALLETAAAAVRRTAGRFDPSVLPALEAIGYDRSIDQVRAVPPRQPAITAPCTAPASPAGVRFGSTASRARSRCRPACASTSAASPKAPLSICSRRSLRTGRAAASTLAGMPWCGARRRRNVVDDRHRGSASP